MTRTRLSLWLAALAIVVLVPACAKKKVQAPPPEVPPAAVQPEQPATEVEPRDQGAVVDQTPDPLAGDIVAVNEYVTRNGLLGDVYFDFDKADLTEESRSRLAKNAEWLRAHPEFEVRIEGHCDERGTNEYNLALGERRAAAAMGYIASLGASAGSLTTLSYGEERPQCGESSEGCWARNRRAHFLITGRVAR
ncbi:MAG TPA: peptidoglycan-associated lipoprotein Pal [Thermoanaerobaculia bacterium]|nr:peptidoglycan-associated lipoprotein Pal [Thermoanaerobaculia bacterium]